MRSDLSERLMAHFVAGAWRAPLSERMRDLPLRFGSRPARLVEAGDADVHRALGAAMQASGRRLPDDWRARARQALDAVAKDIAALRAIETGGAERFVLRAPPSLGRCVAPILVLGCASAPAGLVAGCILAGLEAGRPVLFKPAPRASASAVLIVEALARAGLPAGAFALLQGGGATTGATLLSAVAAGNRGAVPAALLAGKPALRAVAGGGCPRQAMSGLVQGVDRDA